MIEILPNFGTDLPESSSYMDLHERATAACNTVNMLKTYGMPVEPCSEDDFVAELIVMAYAKDPDDTSKTMNRSNFSDLTPYAVTRVASILDEFGQHVAKKAGAVRNLVYNSLIIESRHPDARIRLRALELLGKTTDVGLFSDKKEVTITHQTSEEVRDRLREKLIKLQKTAEGVYEPSPTPQSDG